MSSLSGMKEALKDSLTRQWDAQQQKKEQLAALTHDIKTPLTVIKGNAELLAETDLSAENWECTDAILANVGSMEQYLEHMRQLLYGRDRAEETEVVTCARLKEQFKEAAMQIAAAEKVRLFFRRIPVWECMLQARTGWQSVEKCGQQCGGTHRPGARDRGAPADGSV